MHASSGFRIHDPSAWASKNVSCFKPRSRNNLIFCCKSIKNAHQLARFVVSSEVRELFAVNYKRVSDIEDSCINVLKIEVEVEVTTDGQSASVSWYRAPIWNP